MKTKIEEVKVHKEPEDITKEFGAIKEKCVDCKKPTVYWMADKHTPLCPDCAKKRE